jgi:F0F1-type ATP synthase assembly protein I
MTKAHTSAPSPTSSSPKKEAKTESNPTSVFISMALDMTWRLAIVVLVPIIGGFKLDEHFRTTPGLTILGFLIAMTGTGLVMWQTLRSANNLPVSKKEKK